MMLSVPPVQISSSLIHETLIKILCMSKHVMRWGRSSMLSPEEYGCSLWIFHLYMRFSVAKESFDRYPKWWFSCSVLMVPEENLGKVTLSWEGKFRNSDTLDWYSETRETSPDSISFSNSVTTSEILDILHLTSSSRQSKSAKCFESLSFISDNIFWIIV